MEVEDLGAKAIVFSQFVNMLDVRSVILIETGLIIIVQLLEFRIQRGGMQCVKLLGSMNIDQRDKVS
jgi:SNF2 family DNA or RNA helicase